MGYGIKNKLNLISDMKGTFFLSYRIIFINCFELFSLGEGVK